MIFYKQQQHTGLIMIEQQQQLRSHHLRRGHRCCTGGHRDRPGRYGDGKYEGTMDISHQENAGLMVV